MTTRRSAAPPAAHRLLAPLPGALAAAFAAVVLTAAPAGAAGGADTTGPGITTDATRLVPGRPVTVTGTDWPAGATVQAEVCGLRAVHGSSDCDTTRGAVALVAADGTFRLTLLAGGPPADCPCVIRATTGAGQDARTATADIAVADVPEGVVPDTGTTAPEVTVVDAELTGNGGLSEFFGGRPHRTLVVTVRNTGTATLGRTPLTVRWGAGGRVDTDIAAPLTAPLKPGEQATYRVPVTMPLAAFGRYSVGGEYASRTFVVTTDLYPWGLISVAGASVLLTVFSTGWAIRRRLNRPPAPVPPPAPAVFPAPAAVQVTPEGLASVLATLPAHPGDPAEPAEPLGLEGLLRRLADRPALIDPTQLDALEALLAPCSAPAPQGPATAATATTEAGGRT
ncbi:hypothetical protein AB0L71_08985 [Streptomyces sp. NPDC052052]|uniref:hypothetical protein n=1 Tax=Streptomyces sp. NPDC052052 TaxID=3154756 RepID=UPI00342F43BD